MAANAQQVYNAPYSQFVYGPTVDGGLVPGLPAELLANNRFNDEVRILMGHNSDEGLAFTNPNSVSNDTFTPNLASALPTLPKADLDFVASTLYPPIFNGSYGYKDGVMRQAIAAADFSFNCNIYAMGKYTRDAYAYEFSVYPGLHGLDLAYTFYSGPGTAPAAAATQQRRRSIADHVMQGLERAAAPRRFWRRQDQFRLSAVAMQDWIVSFAMTGTPKSSIGPAFDKYGKDQKILRLLADNVLPVAVKDDVVAERCEAWINRLLPDL
jgi:carboxylesterase type B